LALLKTDKSDRFSEVVRLKSSFFSLVLFSFTFAFFFFTAVPTRVNNHFVGPVAEAHTPMIAPLMGRRTVSGASVKSRMRAASASLRRSHAIASKRKTGRMIAGAHTGRKRVSRKRHAGSVRRHVAVKSSKLTKVVVTKGVSTKAAKIATAAASMANRMDSRGYCYRGVKRALCPLGIELSGQSAYMAKNILKEDKRFKVVGVNEFDNLLPGDILVHGKSKAHPNGHIAVYLGNGQEASDHVQGLVTSPRYGGAVIFRMM
jgi:hypothetical protein